MATSGSLLSSGWKSSSDYVYLEFHWYVTDTSIESNQKAIYWELRGKRTSSGYVTCAPFLVKLDDETVYSSSTHVNVYNGTIITYGSKIFTHEPDGTRSFKVYIGGGIYEHGGYNVTGEKTFELDTIPRASTITAAASVTLGNKCDIRWTPLSASFRYKLEFVLGTWKHTTAAIHPNKTSSYTYSNYVIPLEVAEQITDGPTGLMRVNLYSYSDAGATNQIGSADPEAFTVTVPKSMSPTLTMDIAPVHTLPAAFDGLYIQGLSKVKATLNGEPQYDARINSYDMTVDNRTYGVYDNYTSAYLTNVGDFKVKGHVQDSRRYDGYAEETITVIPYAKPVIQNVTARRCDKDGNQADNGTYLKITAKRSYYPVKSNGVQKNFCAIQYRYKAEGASNYSEWYTILAADNLSKDEVVTGAELNGDLSTDKSYRVEVQAIDSIGYAAISPEIIISTDKIYWHRDGARNALGLGKYNEQDNALDSAWDIHMNGHTVTGLADPKNNSDAVTLGYLKEYVEAYIANLPKG